MLHTFIDRMLCSAADDKRGDHSQREACKKYGGWPPWIFHFNRRDTPVHFCACARDATETTVQMCNYGAGPCQVAEEGPV